ncbi:hypothetical protein FXW05_06820 [Staphylococcus pseudintermedius]|uniref:hypothetical protein n=1 Tax=Staphylococcus pseudintermedius TaxID=283734 RepID=UPI000BBC52B7|nr:hypothetical protein [Staphylococcus pseudintermedius]EGQ1654045.1 hypothetical protein [Staphylococcus pseudintermedius]EGQ1667168.1 hypothetical protein [Staphylococcus pseudintermedius]EGQ1671540.1 hypothetical protein [Staphylococcus pseudintermedius]EGQ1692822.1 hypothetical protein [Staphylococcus pseudintermedius]EGQ1708486.1 hypothetical protein [Staphylococcus pseudintermedius]
MIKRSHYHRKAVAVSSMHAFPMESQSSGQTYIICNNFGQVFEIQQDYSIIFIPFTHIFQQFLIINET